MLVIYAVFSKEFKAREAMRVTDCSPPEEALELRKIQSELADETN